MFGALAGLVAGLIGVAVMEGFQTLWLKAKERLGADGSGDAVAALDKPVKVAALAEADGAKASDPATAKVAAAAKISATGGRLEKAEKEPAGPRRSLRLRRGQRDRVRRDPVSTHAYAFASHVVCCVAVEAVRQLVRPVLPA